MGQRNRQLRPETRGPIDDKRRTAQDPVPPPMDHDVPLLASPDALERVQADNRLRARGVEGLLAVARFLPRMGTTPEQLVEAIEFISNAELKDLDAAQNADVRALLAGGLDSSRPPRVRQAAAWALRIHGPGAVSTAFLGAIRDPERRVRWAVVERFGEHPEEIDKAQRLILVKLLDAGTADEFDTLDANDKDGFLAPADFMAGEAEFRRLDADGDGRVSRQEWLNPVDSATRTDVLALLRRLRDRLTPDSKQINYNPDLPAGTQREAFKEWQNWAESVPGAN